MDRLTTFANRKVYGSAVEVLRARGVRFEVISPDPGYAQVGVPALAAKADAAPVLSEVGAFVSGWVDYRAPARTVPAATPPAYAEDIMGECAIMVLAPCVADAARLRLIAHTAGDISRVFPYLNAEMPAGSYGREPETLTYQDAYRMISLYAHRITIAKTDDIVDSWRVLESVRRLVNETWLRRGSIEPMYERRSRPPALEIYKRLPGTSCRRCGEKACLAFACRLWRGEGSPSECRPVFDDPAYAHLREPLLQICSGLGLAAGEGTDDGEAGAP